MYIFANALKNISRNKGRNILIGVILFILIFATGISLIIHDSSLQIIDGYKNKFGATVILSRDNSKTPVNTSEYKEPDAQMYEALSKSPLLKGSTITASAAARVLKAKAIGEGTVSGSGLNREEGSKKQNGYISPTNMIIGISKETAKASYNSKARKIVKGKVFENDNEVMVSQELAKLNNWNIGDEITVEMRGVLGSQAAQRKVKISAFYVDTLPEKNADDLKTAYTNKKNQIIMTYNAVKETADKASKNIAKGTNSQTEGKYGDTSYIMNVSAYFEIKDPSKIKELEADFRKAGLPEYFNVKVDDSAYKNIVVPVENMTSITKTFVIAIIILGGIVLIILSSIAIRERKYEVGVLRAMGMKKGSISLGLLSEMLIITTITLILGLGGAAFASKPVANTLFNSQIASSQSSGNNSQERNSNYADMSGPFQASSNDVEEISTIQAGLSVSAASKLILTSLLLASLSSVAGILFVTRYEPARILSERN